MSAHLTTLPNGLRVASVAMPHLETAALGVWIEAGSRYESKTVNGVAHMLEHMAFKGTERRDALAIVAEIERVGGHLNAYTGREQTAYTARVLKDDVPLALDILADILQHSVFDETELARERSVVLQEIAQVDDTPDDLVFDHFQGAAHPDQPLGRSILGPAEFIAKIPRSVLADYRRVHYTGSRMVVAAAGPIEHRRLVEEATRLFGALPADGVAFREGARYVGGEAREHRDLEQIHLVLGFNGIDVYDDDYYAVAVLSTLLGGGMSSRLFQEVREKRGLAYSVYSFTTSYQDGGLVGVYAGTTPERIDDLVPVLCGEIARLGEPASSDEVLSARNQMKAGLLMSLESPAARAEQIARQILVFGRVVPIPEIIGRIDAVDASALARLARRLLAGGRPTLAAVGPVASLPDHEAIARRLVAA